MTTSIFLYHGTDERLLKMSLEEHKEYFKAINIVLDFLWKIFEKELNCDPFTESLYQSYNVKFDDIGHHLINAAIIARGFKKNNKLFEYGSIYVTRSLVKASGFARDAFAGGERGYAAYYLIKAFETLNLSEKFNPDCDVCKAISKIQKFAESEKAQPVIVSFEITSTDCLKEEDGKALKENFEYISKAEDGNFRINKDISEGKIIGSPKICSALQKALSKERCRDYWYYGEELDELECEENHQFPGIDTLGKLFAVLECCWCRETAYPSCQSDWVPNDPSYGQCAVTSMIVHDLFGGTIHKIRVEGGGTHYFNKINGEYVDLTREQFDLYDIPVEYEPNAEVPREYCGINKDTLERFSLLQKKIMEFLTD